MAENTEKIVEVCNATKDKLVALGIEPALVAEIDWCIGSYEFDHNPDGLFMKGNEALRILKSYKEKNPRKVSMKLLKDLERTLV